MKRLQIPKNAVIFGACLLLMLCIGGCKDVQPKDPVPDTTSNNDATQVSEAVVQPARGSLDAEVRAPQATVAEAQKSESIAQSQTPEPSVKEASVTSVSPQSLNPPSQPSPAQPAQATTDVNTPKPIEVSKEVFTQTFSEVEKLVAELNKVVQNKDFAAWIPFLSADYAKRMSSVEVLKQLSESPTLKRLGISLQNLQDYFLNVVVPSRANIRIDDLVFLSENDVEAIMIVGNRRVTVYRLIKIQGQWKIGLS